MDRNQTLVPLSKARLCLGTVLLRGSKSPRQSRGQVGRGQEQGVWAHPSKVKSGSTLIGSVTLSESLSSVPQWQRWLRKSMAPGFREPNFLWAALSHRLCTEWVLRQDHSVETQDSPRTWPWSGLPFGCLATLSFQLCCRPTAPPVLLPSCSFHRCQPCTGGGGLLSPSPPPSPRVSCTADLILASASGAPKLTANLVCQSGMTSRSTPHEVLVKIHSIS